MKIFHKFSVKYKLEFQFRYFYSISGKYGKNYSRRIITRIICRGALWRHELRPAGDNNKIFHRADYKTCKKTKIQTFMILDHQRHTLFLSMIRSKVPFWTNINYTNQQPDTLQFLRVHLLHNDLMKLKKAKEDEFLRKSFQHNKQDEPATQFQQQSHYQYIFCNQWQIL